MRSDHDATPRSSGNTEIFGEVCRASRTSRVPPPLCCRLENRWAQLADHEWRIDFAARDRVGLLARETAVFGELGYDVRDALAVTWGDESAVASFRSVARDVPMAANLKQLL